LVDREDEEFSPSTWEFFHVLETELVSYETRASILFPLAVAGLLTLWTQLSTFEETVPHALAWAAWSLLLLSVAVAAHLVLPRRLTGRGFRDDCPPSEPKAVERLCALAERRIEELERGLVRCLALVCSGLVLAVVAYVVDKAAYPP
jgi:hypothetical protein